MKRADFFAIVALLLVAALLWLFPFLFTKDAPTLLIVTDTATYSYHLSESQTLVLQENGHSLTILIENGEAKVIKATCSDQICVHSAAISRTGQTILCAPAHVLLSITAKEVPYDGITH